MGTVKKGSGGAAKKKSVGARLGAGVTDKTKPGKTKMPRVGSKKKK